jgi:hypothetical protein
MKKFEKKLQEKLDEISPKILESFADVDPFVEFTPKSRSSGIIKLHLHISILSIALFLIYSGFSLYSFIMTPDPSESSQVVLLSDKQTDPMFQINVLTIRSQGSIPCQLEFVQPFDGNLARDPKSFTATIKAIKGNESTINDFPLTCRKYLVYGSVDSKTSTSYFLKVVNKASCSPLFIISLSSDASSDITGYVLEEPTATRRAMLSHPNPKVLVYEAIFNNNEPSTINVDVLVRKTEFALGGTQYEVSFNGPPKYVPDPLQSGSNLDPSLLLSVSPVVSVLSYKPKNVLAMLGSIGGLFPFFLFLGGFAASKLQSRFKTDDSTHESNPIELGSSLAKDTQEPKDSSDLL